VRKSRNCRSSCTASTERGPIGRENSPPRARASSALYASTERGPIGRENLVSNKCLSLHLRSFNGARPDRPRERCRFLSVSPVSRCFNGARPDRPRERNEKDRCIRIIHASTERGPIGRENTVLATTSASHCSRLQRSAARSAARTRSTVAFSRSTECFNGARPDRPRELDSCGGPGRRREASTERGPIGRENPRLSGRGSPNRAASTERGPIGRENPYPFDATIYVSGGFNGARPDRPREPDSPRRARCRACSFNGARPDRPREHDLLSPLGLERAASTERGPIGRENVGRCSRGPTRRCFNGARPDRPRELCNPCGVAAKAHELQRSAARSAARTVLLHVRVDV